MICRMYKKGDKTVRQLSRYLSLACVTCDVFTKALSNRLKPYSENVIGEYQAGFGKGRSAVDGLRRQLLNKCCELSVYVLVGCKQACAK